MLSAAAQEMPVQIQCPNCKRTGHASWEGPEMPGKQGIKPVLKHLSEGFIHRKKGSLSALPKVVCLACGAIVID